MAAPNNSATAPTEAPATVPITAPSEDGFVEADNDGNDSAYDGSHSASDWTSVTSSIYRGVIENGRRYQSLKEGEYWGPSDEQQFESMANNHLCQLLYDQFEENQYFRSPIGENATHILDVGTGEGQWAIDVADKFPEITVHGVDLHPPPQTWVPPNCILGVDDVSKPWMWSEKFDLVHIRWLVASFTDAQWKRLYREAYKNLKPGGWIEQIEPDVYFNCDDDSFGPDSALLRWGPLMADCAAKIDIKVNTLETMRGFIEEAGFVNVHEKSYKWSHGPWVKGPLMKEIGRIHLHATKQGVEGYGMMMLTHFGSPKPWTTEEVQLELMRVRQELDGKTPHSYTNLRRVWAQKPLDATD